MGIEKDTTFKFIGKNFLEVLFQLANIPDSVDATKMEEVTEELISLKIAQFRPDFVGKNENVIVMLEFESSFVGTPSKKRFHAYVALYGLEHNEDNLDIIFCVITTQEISKVVEYKIGDVDTFKFVIFNIRDLGFEKIINNAKDKIEKQEVFSTEELVKLALTSLMPKTRDGIIEQFYNLSEMMDGIIFENYNANLSFCGILLLLSNMYFEINDKIRKKIQGGFMKKVDCIVEFGEEQFEAGLMEAARNFLISGFPVDVVSKNTTLPINQIEKLAQEIESSK